MTHDARIFAPAAARNQDAICEQVLRFAPATGRGLEIASGSGEHITATGPLTPGVSWTPTDPDPTRRASIDAWRVYHGCENVHPAVHLDAAEPGWSDRFSGQNIVLLVNLLHLIRADAARTVAHEAARALAPGGHALFYGPFLREGKTTSAGDAQFDATLRSQDPRIGYKDHRDVEAWLVDGGLQIVETKPMPANNLMIVAQRG